MQYVKLGSTGVDVSRICLGCMSFGKPGKENGLFPQAKDYDDAKPIFKKAVDLGINYFDTANVYQMGTSEEITGRLIKDFGLNRDEIVVATAAFDRLNKYFGIANMNVVGSQYWNMVHGFTPDDVRKDKEGLQTMRTLGENMAWLLKCIELGRKNGINKPEYEDITFTNFIN